jgi:hypothetical protein
MAQAVIGLDVGVFSPSFFGDSVSDRGECFFSSTFGARMQTGSSSPSDTPLLHDQD